MSETTPYQSPIWLKRKWSDNYPDEFEVLCQKGAKDGISYVVVTGQAVWLTPEQVAEVILHLAECKVSVESRNAALRAAQNPPSSAVQS